MKFYFCEGCGRRITEADLSKGGGRDKKLRGVYCTACAQGVMTLETLPMDEEQARKVLGSDPAITPPTSPLPVTPPRMARRSSASVIPAARRQELPVSGEPEAVSSAATRRKTALAIGSVGVGLILAGAAILVFVPSRTSAQPHPTDAQAPETVAPPVGPAQPGTEIATPAVHASTPSGIAQKPVQPEAPVDTGTHADREAYSRLLTGVAEKKPSEKLALAEAFLRDFPASSHVPQLRDQMARWASEDAEKVIASMPEPEVKPAVPEPIAPPRIDPALEAFKAQALKFLAVLKEGKIEEAEGQALALRKAGSEPYLAAADAIVGGSRFLKRRETLRMEALKSLVGTVAKLETSQGAKRGKIESVGAESLRLIPSFEINGEERLGDPVEVHFADLTEAAWIALTPELDADPAAPWAALLKELAAGDHAAAEARVAQQAAHPLAPLVALLRKPAKPAVEQPPSGAAPEKSRLLAVDFGSSENAHRVGFEQWHVIKDPNSRLSKLGPGGVVRASLNRFGAQGIRGPGRLFAEGVRIEVTWFNAGDAPVTFAPRISLEYWGPMAVEMNGGKSRWSEMSALTLKPGQTGVTAWVVDAASAGQRGVLGVGYTPEGDGTLVCDKIELLPAPGGVEALAGAAPPLPAHPPKIVDGFECGEGSRSEGRPLNELSAGNTKMPWRASREAVFRKGDADPHNPGAVDGVILLDGDDSGMAVAMGSMLRATKVYATLDVFVPLDAQGSGGVYAVGGKAGTSIEEHKEPAAGLMIPAAEWRKHGGPGWHRAACWVEVKTKTLEIYLDGRKFLSRPYEGFEWVYYMGFLNLESKPGARWMVDNFKLWILPESNAPPVLPPEGQPAVRAPACPKLPLGGIAPGWVGDTFALGVAGRKDGGSLANLRLMAGSYPWESTRYGLLKAGQADPRNPGAADGVWTLNEQHGDPFIKLSGKARKPQRIWAAGDFLVPEDGKGQGSLAVYPESGRGEGPQALTLPWQRDEWRKAGSGWRRMILCVDLTAQQATFWVDGELACQREYLHDQVDRVGFQVRNTPSSNWLVDNFQFCIESE